MNTIVVPQLVKLEEYFDQPSLFVRVQSEIIELQLKTLPVFENSFQVTISPFLKSFLQAYEELLLVSFHSETRAVEWHSRHLNEISNEISEVGKQFEYLVNQLFARFEGIYT